MEASTRPIIPAIEFPGYQAAAERVREALTAARSATEVRDEATANTATEILSALATARKEAEAARREIVGPFNEQSKKVNEGFKEMLGPINGAERSLKQQVIAFQVEQQRKIDEEQARLDRNARERQERADAKAATTGQEPKQHEAPKLPEAQRTRAASSGGGVSVKKVWKVRITDEAKIPREFLEVDTAKLNAALREKRQQAEQANVTFDGVLDIPGVEAYQHDQAAVR